MTTNNFITKAQTKFGNKYNYCKVKYENAKTKVCIICPIHGEFWQRPTEHLNCKEACPKCSGRYMDTDLFIKKSKQIHGDKYDYSKTVYTKSSNKVVIICPEHGEFLQTANSHLNGRGCSFCAKRKFSLEEFKKQASIIWNNKYDYSNTKYLGYGVPIEINCPEHGKFYQLVGNHLKGECGCLECSGKSKDFRKINSTEELIKQGVSKFGEKFNYSLTKFIDSKTKCTFICPEHGQFKTLPYRFIQNTCGCPKCTKKQSKIWRYKEPSQHEIYIAELLKELKLEFTPQFEILHPKLNKKFIVDFYIQYKDTKYFIEYNGKQHYEFIPFFHRNGIEDFKKQQKRDELLREICSICDIKLLEIPYTTPKKEILEIIKKFIF